MRGHSVQLLADYVFGDGLFCYRPQPRAAAIQPPPTGRGRQKHHHSGRLWGVSELHFELNNTYFDEDNITSFTLELHTRTLIFIDKEHFPAQWLQNVSGRN